MLSLVPRERNDLPLVPKKRRVKSYVDGTKLLISFKIKESSEAFANLTDDLHRIGQWCSINNLLLLNPSKTKFMVLGRKYVLDWSLLAPLLWAENSFLNTLRSRSDFGH